MEYSCAKEKNGKTKTLKNLEVFNEVLVEFPETKQFLEEHVEQKFLRFSTDKVDMKNSFTKMVVMVFFYNVNHVEKDAF